MAEWHAKGKARYGPLSFLRQTSCDFLDDSTCVSVFLVDTTDDKRQKIRNKYDAIFILDVCLV